jgi:hypothetical protein
MAESKFERISVRGAATPTATVTVSDWPNDKESTGDFGQEQRFNLLEIQPSHE